MSEVFYSFSIQNDIDSQSVDNAKLKSEVEKNQDIIIQCNGVRSTGDVLKIYFSASIGTFALNSLKDNTVKNHDGTPAPIPKIKNLVDFYKKTFNFKDIDYTLAPLNNLFPKRTFVQGELQKVEWYSDGELTELILKVDISYTRDTFGFAVERTTTRTWIDEQGNEIDDKKITVKKYSLNPIDQIKEGKRRRGNIVDGIQLPTMSFMVETMTVEPWNLSAGAILLMGRDFMDRHEMEFAKFVDNSSSITDFNDPNFGRKTIAVAIETAANTTDTWLKNTPSALGGASIEQYLVGEFSI